MIPWVEYIYSMMQLSSRCSIPVELWNCWFKYNNPFWSLTNILSMSTTWLYLSTNLQILYHQSSSICMLNHCPKLKILIYTIVSLSEVNIVLWHTLQTCMTPTWYTCYNTGRIQGSMWQGWRYIRWVLCKLWWLLVANSRSKTFAESILYQPWSARCDSVSWI